MSGLTEEVIVRVLWHPGAETARVLSITSSEGHELPVGSWEHLLGLSLAAAGENWSDCRDLTAVAR